MKRNKWLYLHGKYGRKIVAKTNSQRESKWLENCDLKPCSFREYVDRKRRIKQPRPE